MVYHIFLSVFVGIDLNDRWSYHSPSEPYASLELSVNANREMHRLQRLLSPNGFQLGIRFVQFQNAARHRVRNCAYVCLRYLRRIHRNKTRKILMISPRFGQYRAAYAMDGQTSRKFERSSFYESLNSVINCRSDRRCKCNFVCQHSRNERE